MFGDLGGGFGWVVLGFRHVHVFVVRLRNGFGAGVVGLLCGCFWLETC